MYLNDVVVGIDVASDSFVAAILAPDGSICFKPRKYEMSKIGFDSFIAVLKEKEKLYSSRPKIFLESTGIYHRQLFFHLIKEGFESHLINPLALNNITFESLRKVKNDAVDALKIAFACKQLNIKTCYVPDSKIQTLRSLVRTYYALADNKADLKIRLSNELHAVFPGLINVFSDITTLTPMKFLEFCPTPDAFMNTPKDEVISLFRTYSRKGATWANNKYDLIMDCAMTALKDSENMYTLGIAVHSYLILIQQIENQLNSLVSQVESLLNNNPAFNTLKEAVILMQSFPGVGFISAVALIAEIGDITRFSSPKQLVAYMGIDPNVNESGKFKGDRNRISKRGSRLGRRVLFTVAMASIRTTKNKQPVNSVLRNFYQEKCVSKKKKVALVAVMNKLVKYMFAVLRDNKPYEIREPETHKSLHAKFQLKKSVA